MKISPGPRFYRAKIEQGGHKIRRDPNRLYSIATRLAPGWFLFSANETTNMIAAPIAKTR
jgi:hypothetical protein